MNLSMHQSKSFAKKDLYKAVRRIENLWPNVVLARVLFHFPLLFVCFTDVSCPGLKCRYLFPFILIIWSCSSLFPFDTKSQTAMTYPTAAAPNCGPPIAPRTQVECCSVCVCCVVLGCVVLGCVALGCVAWGGVVCCYVVLLRCVVLCCVALGCVALGCVAWGGVVLCCVVWCCVVLLSCVVLCCVALGCVVLRCVG